MTEAKESQAHPIFKSILDSLSHPQQETLWDVMERMEKQFADFNRSWETLKQKIVEQSHQKKYQATLQAGKEGYDND